MFPGHQSHMFGQRSGFRAGPDQCDYSVSCRLLIVGLIFIFIIFSFLPQST